MAGWGGHPLVPHPLRVRWGSLGCQALESLQEGELRPQGYSMEPVARAGAGAGAGAWSGIKAYSRTQEPACPVSQLLICGLGGNPVPQDLQGWGEVGQENRVIQAEQ